MKILFIGSFGISNEGNFAQFQDFCINLGRKLSSSHIELLLCSPFEKSVDYELLMGVLSERNIKVTLRLFYPKSDLIEKKWYSILKKLPGGSYTHFTFGGFNLEEKEARKFAWLYCQLQALEEANIIVALGGNEDGASDLFFKIAETRKKIIIPITEFGGSARKVFNTLKYQIKDKLGETLYNKIYLEDLSELTIAALSNALHDGKVFLSNPKINFEPIFFLSYARARPAEADQIEMLLRRRNYVVLRDEVNIGAGDDLLNSISENIAKSNVFIAIWCKEYACSPYCYDELEEAIERHSEQKTELWIIRIEDVRIVPKKARDILYVDGFDRETIEGKILSLIEGL